MSRKKSAPLKEHYKKVQPITKNQEAAFTSYKEGYNLVLSGYAGTGKTYIAMAMAFEALFDNSSIDNIIIVRSAVPTQDLGHLPGTFEEKIAPYEEPYESICSDLFKVKGVYDHMKELGYITFMPVSFIRGLTFDNSIIVVDEFQNCNFHALDSVITRVGNNSRIIFSGDSTQSDLKKTNEKHDVIDFTNILDTMPQFRHIQFGENDIVRSELVKDYIIRKHKAGK